MQDFHAIQSTRLQQWRERTYECFCVWSKQAENRTVQWCMTYASLQKGILMYVYQNSRPW
jgi:hypothetical protein